jgi:hypothetical protein
VLNLTLFTLPTRGSTCTFIGGLRWYSGCRLGTWCPLIRPVGHATCPGGQVSFLHYLWALDTLITASSGHVDKIVSRNTPTHCQPAKVMWPVGHTLARLAMCWRISRNYFVNMSRRGSDQGIQCPKIVQEGNLATRPSCMPDRPDKWCFVPHHFMVSYYP